MSDIGKLIKARRLELGLTLEAVAQKVGVTRSTVRKWEEGMIGNMRSDKLDALAEALQMSPVDLIAKPKKKSSIRTYLVEEPRGSFRIVGASSKTSLLSPANMARVRTGVKYGIADTKVVAVKADSELNNMIKLWKVSTPEAKKLAMDVLKVTSDKKKD